MLRILISVFTEISLKLGNGIEAPTIKFHDFLEQCGIIQLDNPFSITKLKTFFSFQINKTSGYDGISFNIVKHYFVSLHKPLLHIFYLSIQREFFSDELKLARGTPVLTKL